MNVSRWFDTCVNQPQFQKVLGKISLCEKMVPVTPKPNPASTDAAGNTGTANGGKDETSRTSVSESFLILQRMSFSCYTFVVISGKEYVEIKGHPLSLKFCNFSGSNALLLWFSQIHLRQKPS